MICRCPAAHGWVPSRRALPRRYPSCSAPLLLRVFTCRFATAYWTSHVHGVPSDRDAPRCRGDRCAIRPVLPVQPRLQFSLHCFNRPIPPPPPPRSLFIGHLDQHVCGAPQIISSRCTDLHTRPRDANSYSRTLYHYAVQPELIQALVCWVKIKPHNLQLEE